MVFPCCIQSTKGKILYANTEFMRLFLIEKDTAIKTFNLEHVENLSEYISNLKKLLSTHGRLIIAAPNFKSDDANYYKEFWAAFDVPRHLWHFSQDSIRQLFLSENMVIEKTIPMKFDSYYVSLLSEKYKKGRMNIVNALYRGFVSNCKAMTSSEYSSLIYVIKKD